MSDPHRSRHGAALSPEDEGGVPASETDRHAAHDRHPATSGLPELTEDGIRELLRRDRFDAAVAQLRLLPAGDVLEFLDRCDPDEVPILFRLLEKDTAVRVFTDMEPRQQSDLIAQLQDGQVQDLFGRLHTSSQARLVDEMPAKVARRLLDGLGPEARDRAGELLGYPAHSVGRRVRTAPVRLRRDWSVAHALEQVRVHGEGDRRALAALPVVGDLHRVVGIVELGELTTADPGGTVEALMDDAVAVPAGTEAEEAARLCADRRLWFLPVTDDDGRLIGMFTVADALQVLDEESTEDAARSGGAEPLGRPYLSTPVMTLMRARIVWLLVLAVGATLTVQVLEVFEETLEQLVVLSLFVPLVIGTGGNTGNQAATTVTRALALDDVRPRDALRVMLRELRVGFTLGACLGGLGTLVAGLFYGWDIGAVIGLTLLSVCTLAATVGGLMPLAGKKVGVDPAVFSNPFISTLVDALGLVLYFLIARALLGL
ncbi:Mg/Co/Ni transporter MgtE / CBS domain [Micrococcus lylae]|uniref:Magnesium transporter MgtE n=1 Tax=Micrococcus lylae TaxID=1273 RepID=A0A1R4JR64_9MICC|nr:magnesium transporter [Micrococcus lylae]SJN34472.1 Mg/Co/Ni transporter MgtE / CBS domain [Micrococcus lylae]